MQPTTVNAAPDPSLVLKITPPKLRRSLVVRERLRELRARGEDVAVFQVEAPAGFGKTSLLAQWRMDWLQSGASVGWLSLDGADTPVSVISGIVHGLRRSRGKPGFCNDALEAIRRGAATEAAITSLLAEISETAMPTVLIFDNCERVSDAAALEAFDYLLHNLTPNLQVVIGTRPPSPIVTTDLLAQIDLRRITVNDLRLQLPETIRLLSTRLGGGADPDLCARLHEATEGWPLGLQLAAATLEQSTDPSRSVALIGNAGDDAMRRLLDGMLDALPEPLADFLTRCALVSPLHPSLCEAVSANEDAALLLQRLLVETPLLTAAEEGEWLRLHPLAREHLQARAGTQLSMQERMEIHRRAWHWLSAHGYAERAAQQAMAAGERSAAMEMIADALYREMNQGHAGIVMSWLQRLAPAEVQSNAVLRAVSVAMAALGGASRDAWPAAVALAQDPTVEEWIQQEAVWAQMIVCGFSDDLERALGLMRLIRPEVASPEATRSLANAEGYIGTHQGKTEAARQQIQAGNPDDGKTPAVRMWGDAFTLLTYTWEGRPAYAETFARSRYATWESRSGRRDPWVSLLGATVASCLWMLDEREEVRALLAHRLDAIELVGIALPIANAYRTAAQLASASGDEVRAITCLERLAGLGIERNLPRFTVVSLAERTRLNALHRRPREAVEALRELDAVFESLPPGNMVEPVLRLEQAMARAFAGWAAGDLQMTGEALLDASARAHGLNRGYEIVQALMLQALLAHRRGDASAPLLLQALSRAEAGGLVRVFADTLPEAIELIHLHGKHSELASVSSGFIERVLGAASIRAASEQAPQASAGSAILTAKEDQVLRLLAGGLPNKRIASQMGLSTETVKWHIKKLFTKLNAGTRDHAVDRARMLGLLQ